MLTLSYSSHHILTVVQATFWTFPHSATHFHNQVTSRFDGIDEMRRVSRLHNCRRYSEYPENVVIWAELLRINETKTEANLIGNSIGRPENHAVEGLPAGGPTLKACLENRQAAEKATINLNLPMFQLFKWLTWCLKSYRVEGTNLHSQIWIQKYFLFQLISDKQSFA